MQWSYSVRVIDKTSLVSVKTASHKAKYKSPIASFLQTGNEWIRPFEDIATKQTEFS